MRFAALLLLLAVSALARPGAEALVILAGDQHSAYERTAQVVAAVDRLKAENPALPLAVLLNGDTLEYGNVVARRSAGAVDFAMFAALARRAPTIVNLGNHEPEFHDLAETVRRIEATGARVVTNITDRNTGRLAAPASVKLKLGPAEAIVAGVSTDNLSTYRVALRPSLDLTDPVVWAERNFPGFWLHREKNTSPAIVLSHAGIKADRGMFRFVPPGALFAGAHDHQRFIHSFDGKTYVHSGSWNEYLTLAWLFRDTAGVPRWEVEQVRVETAGPADPELAALIRETRAKHLTVEETAVVAKLPAALGPGEAARLAARRLREAAGVDAAFIGNTTFGAGLPEGEVTREQFDACVRFDGSIFTAEVDGARLRQLLAAANLTPDTPFEQRRGEFSFAEGPADIDPAKTYRIATTDWGARNSARYYGEPAIVWTERQPVLRLKAAVLSGLAGTNPPTAGR
jgi:5'-nucleotidase/UDP-sugar diphosphatase